MYKHTSLEQEITNCKDSIASIKEAMAYDQSILSQMSQEHKDYIKERNTHREGMMEAYLYVIASITGDYSQLHTHQDEVTERKNKEAV